MNNKPKNKFGKIKDNSACKMDRVGKSVEEMQEFRRQYDADIKQKRQWLNQQIQQTAAIAAHYNSVQTQQQQPLSPSTDGRTSVPEDEQNIYSDIDNCISKLCETDPNEKHLAKEWNAPYSTNAAH
ncbi:uncharacterized protein LOC121389037 [Gigantopelta aegis]|uniref:uncharacterized protein LOC121389037 n=1 Tax=Gigantopelta aegis TaxID=1735272 RepID=UPI001B88E467|nr:uncharacterized protein LOC121389037 [Gigantopelta aegis]XP_041376580.1 uncharacterized protein LOC121389037 [Gigantopelta aegis]